MGKRMNFNAETLAAELSKRGLAWSDCEAAAALLEETRKTVLSECQADHPEDSNAASEAKALRDPRYKEHLKAMVEARRLANRARVNYDVIRAYEGLFRTQEATRRAEASIR